ncbi:AI-2E family transporter [Mucilaginibacter hurinus]|uniref:AI-2E family transporter n=1 Tax=Mucilaginibacter hurinus TaxID=2201324 RepID=A0A367GR96_9SPHI|nr:AI-2E family transporter [Mucilaginibacter hurinus]RCH55790.1 AI-2E family transporter [Mucilaginibacter hurinus]
MAKLQRSVLVLFLFFLIFSGLYFSKEFLVPIAISAILAMLFIGFSNFLERRGISRAFSALFSMLVLLISIGLIVFLLSLRLSEFAADFDTMKTKLTELLDNLKQWVRATIGLSVKEQEKILKQGQESAGNGGAMAAAVLASLMGMAVNLVLGIVYMYLFLYNRSHIKKFFIMLVPDSVNRKTDIVIHESAKVAQKYLSGLGGMIACLWVMYGIGFTLVGVENAIFFAVLCGILEIVPFVGNLTGTSLTVLTVLVQGGSGSMVIGVLGTYFVIQFVQTYILEPLIVGEQVSINPLFTIMAIVLGEMVWGIPGMILAIPLLGIVKIICDNVPELKPYGFLIGSEPKKKKTGVIDKLKKLIGK